MAVSKESMAKIHKQLKIKRNLDGFYCSCPNNFMRNIYILAGSILIFFTN